MNAAVELVQAPQGDALDWSSPEHYSEERGRCRHCRRLTHMRDDDGRPAHKACAEQRRTDRCPK